MKSKRTGELAIPCDQTICNLPKKKSPKLSLKWRDIVCMNRTDIKWKPSRLNELHKYLANENNTCFWVARFNKIILCLAFFFQIFFFLFAYIHLKTHSTYSYATFLCLFFCSIYPPLSAQCEVENMLCLLLLLLLLGFWFVLILCLEWVDVWANEYNQMSGYCT